MADRISKQKAYRYIAAEMDRGKVEFGEYASKHEALAVIEEEFLEFRQEIFHPGSGSDTNEAIQLAATVMRFVIEFGNDSEADWFHWGLAPPTKG